MTDKYPAFPSIKRLKRTMTITEKIDGTNGLIFIDERSNVVSAGSRNRWLEPTPKSADNFGFARWVSENVDTLVKDLGPGLHYGEWWGAGIQRTYGLDNKFFSLFNVGRWGDVPFETPELLTVPVLYVGDFSTDIIDSQIRELEKYGSKAVLGFDKPEGVVVFHHATRSLAKVTLDGDGHKGGKG